MSSKITLTADSEYASFNKRDNRISGQLTVENCKLTFTCLSTNQEMEEEKV